MNHSLTYYPLRKSLIKQLIYIEENTTELLDLYVSSTMVHDRDFNFFKRYVAEVEAFLSDDEKSTYPALSKVFIGCQVAVLFKEDNYIEHFTICFPEQSDPTRGYISFLSPVGRQLLLHALDEEMVLVTPGGETNITITKIEFKDYQ
ncbi:GreA/GreB family elongation factor [Aneurinibacillus sp. REN35]|uniref:GreA/GreB family elongation factor n=1 Tax=Aneurinibacillus sp. REN35 TaxID=3237286 RepID=UPI003526FFE5